MKRSLRGKVAVVTGGARGIGAATAAVLAAEDAKVVIGDLDPGLAAETAAGLPGEVVALPLDVTDTAGFTAFLDQVEAELGPIDVLVNNAGIMPLGDFEQESESTAARQLDINLRAVIHGTKEAARRMRGRGGHIVNLASFAGKIPVPGGATYSATKHAVVGLSESVRQELRGTGIEVSCVMPGVVRTELTAGLTDLPAVLRSVGPEDVAEAIVRALQRPKFDVYVPRRLAVLDRSSRLLPRAVAEWAMRRLGGDTMMLQAAHSGERTDYEKRAARSA
ncbi:SDR family oxidoreductase [Amycolatopsis nigrescens]|uniref:SDR family oxidoreductase n=1 Tax=Amycolatopsis nigrescens TaxID=381445 RepID=UPI0003668746|nr:SDR family oxidoreductase [Amycolatopsis nigrescens]